MAKLFRLRDYRQKQKTVYFSRPELNQLLSLYSRKVAAGEWRDYAIDHRAGAASFSVFRHTHESPLFTVVKHAAGSSRHGDWLLLSGRQRVLAGRSLAEVLASFEKKLALVQ